MSALTKITAAAKRIRKKQPGKSWKSAVKAASVMYRAGKLGKVAKKAVGKKKAVSKKKVVRKKVARRRVGSVVRPGGYSSATVPGTIAGIKKKTLSDIGNLEAKKFAAKGVREKGKIAKKIAEKKRTYRKLS